MFKPSGAKNTEEYMAMLTDERRNILETVMKLITDTAPELKPHFAYNMPGFGAFNYTNYKKEQLDWPVISIASQKNYVSIYVCAVDGGEYIAEKYAKELGKVNVGKSCIRFKKLEDINLITLKKVIKLAKDNPGLVYAADKKKK